MLGLKYLVIFNFIFTLIVIFCLHCLYFNTKKIEKLTNTNHSHSIDISKIQQAIQEKYEIDIESIRNLSSISKSLQEGGLTIPGDVKVQGKFNYLPKGTIVAFNGTTAPEGWAICDGKNGTPDLRGRFIYGYSGAGRSNKLKGTGGAEYVKLTEAQMPSHNHNLKINNGGNHAHGITTYNDDFNQRGGQHGSLGWENYDSNNLGVFLNTNEGGSHSHGYTMDKTGSSHSHENMPPYCVLLYIIKQ